MDTQRNEGMKSLHVKLPVKLFADVQELAAAKSLPPSTYVRMILVQHTAENRDSRENLTEAALKAGVKRQQRKHMGKYQKAKILVDMGEATTVSFPWVRAEPRRRAGARHTMGSCKVYVGDGTERIRRAYGG